MVAGEQHLGNGAALPLARACIVRVFEKTVLEALLLARRFLAHDARQKPHAGLDHGHSGDLAAGKNEIADRDLAEPARFDDALINGFEAAAADEDARSGGKLPRRALCEGDSARTHEKTRARVIPGDRRIER